MFYEVETVVKVLPSPNQAQKERYTAIWEEKIQRESKQEGSE